MLQHQDNSNKNTKDNLTKHCVKDRDCSNNWCLSWSYKDWAIAQFGNKVDDDGWVDEIVHIHTGKQYFCDNGICNNCDKKVPAIIQYGLITGIL